MKKRIFSLLSAALALTMLFAACAPATGTTPGTSTTTSTGTTGGGTTTGEQYDPFGKYETPITVNVVRSIDSTMKFDEKYPETYSLESNVWSKAYEENLGIKLNYLWTPTSDQYDTKWITSITSGDLPDMGWVSTSVYQMLVEGGLVEDMTDIFDQYASDYYKEQTQADGGVTVDFMTFDGRMLGLPITGTTPDGINLLFVRNDWLDQVKMDPPKTIDELVAVAQAFKDAKLGGPDTYGICMGPYIFGGQCDWEGLVNGYGAYYNIWLDDGSGKLVYSTTLPEMRDALLKLQELYKSGIISKEFATNGNISEDLVSGKVGITYGTYWAPVAAMADQMKSDPNSEWITLPLPTPDGSEMTTQAWGDGLPSQFFFVKKGFKYPEAAVKMLNLGFKLDNEDPMTYNFHEETQIQVQQYRIAALWEPWRNMTNTLKVWDALKSGDTSELRADGLDMYNNILKYREGTLEREKLGYMLVNEEENSSYAIINKLRGEDRIILSKYRTFPTQLMNDKLAIIDQEVYAVMVRVIAGEDISSFDKAVQTWFSSGGQQITDEVNAWYESSK